MIFLVNFGLQKSSTPPKVANSLHCLLAGRHIPLGELLPENAKKPLNFRVHFAHFCLNLLPAVHRFDLLVQLHHLFGQLGVGQGGIFRGGGNAWKFGFLLKFHLFIKSCFPNNSSM